jgi:hypothetical protein
MPLAINITWRSDNPRTIWAELKAKLGREPTNFEAIAEVKRIIAEAAGVVPLTPRRAQGPPGSPPSPSGRAA